MFLCEQGRRAARGAEVEAAVFLARIGHLLGAVAFGEHDHGCAVGLEEIDVSVHAASGGGTEGTGGHPRRGLRRAGVIDGILLEILGQVAGFIEDLLELRVGGIAGDDDRPAEREGGGDGVFGKCFERLLHAEIEIDRYALEFPIAVFLRDETTGILLQLLQENPFPRDLRLRLPVGGAGYADADRARRAVARQADHPDIEREIFPAELRADADLARQN